MKIDKCQECGYVFDGTEDLQEWEGKLYPICLKCSEIEKRRENASMSRCAGDYPVSVMSD